MVQLTFGTVNTITEESRKAWDDVANLDINLELELSDAFEAKEAELQKNSIIEDKLKQALNLTKSRELFKEAIINFEIFPNETKQMFTNIKSTLQLKHAFSIFADIVYCLNLLEVSLCKLKLLQIKYHNRKLLAYQKDIQYSAAYRAVDQMKRGVELACTKNANNEYLTNIINEFGKLLELYIGRIELIRESRKKIEEIDKTLWLELKNELESKFKSCINAYTDLVMIIKYFTDEAEYSETNEMTKKCLAHLNSIQNCVDDYISFAESTLNNIAELYNYELPFFFNQNVPSMKDVSKSNLQFHELGIYPWQILPLVPNHTKFCMRRKKQVQKVDNRQTFSIDYKKSWNTTQQVLKSVTSVVKHSSIDLIKILGCNEMYNNNSIVKHLKQEKCIDYRCSYDHLRNNYHIPEQKLNANYLKNNQMFDAIGTDTNAYVPSIQYYNTQNYYNNNYLIDNIKYVGSQNNNDEFHNSNIYNNESIYQLPLKYHINASHEQFATSYN